MSKEVDTAIAEIEHTAVPVSIRPDKAVPTLLFILVILSAGILVLGILVNNANHSVDKLRTTFKEQSAQSQSQLSAQSKLLSEQQNKLDDLTNQITGDRTIISAKDAEIARLTSIILKAGLDLGTPVAGSNYESPTQLPSSQPGAAPTTYTPPRSNPPSTKPPPQTSLPPPVQPTQPPRTVKPPQVLPTIKIPVPSPVIGDLCDFLVGLGVSCS